MQKTRSVSLSVAFALVATSPFVAARSAPQQTAVGPRPQLSIAWQNGVSSVQAQTPRQASAELARLVARPGKGHVVVQFSRALTAPERRLVAGSGLRLLSPLGNHAWFASGDATTEIGGDAITNINGSVVNVQGDLVKLG